LVPVIVTVCPTSALVGEKEVIVGGEGKIALGLLNSLRLLKHASVIKLAPGLSPKKKDLLVPVTNAGNVTSKHN
jgi:hypothetical protein